MSRKLLFLIADGMGDWPLDELSGKTVLQAAKTPNMDALAAKGICGRAQTVPHGMPPGSDIANMALLGYAPAKHHTGRGPIEAAAQGLELDPDDLVWRLNLVTTSEFSFAGQMFDYSAGHIGTEQAHALINDLQKNLGDEVFSFVPGVQYRHLLVQKGGAVAPEADIHIRPPHDILDKPIEEDFLQFSKSDRLSTLMMRSATRLSSEENTSAANACWPWGQGRPLLLPDFEETFGLKGAVISAVDLVKGLGRASGMTVLDVEGATGLLDTNYAGKVEATLDFMEEGDFAFVHLEGPDECGHGGDVAGKIEAISRFDSQIVAPLIKALPDAAVFIACDHFTPIVERTHTMDPVPFLLSWPGCNTPSGLTCFDEETTKAAGLSIDPGHGLMQWVLDTLK